MIDQALKDLGDFMREVNQQGIGLTPYALDKLGNAKACLQIASSPRSRMPIDPELKHQLERLMETFPDECVRDFLGHCESHRMNNEPCPVPIIREFLKYEDKS